LPKFPVVRDLLVDRRRIDQGLKQVKAWIKIDGVWDTHEGAPRIGPSEWAANYLYSRCMSCGCCMAACPQFGAHSDFLGPAPLAQARLMNAHPTGRYDKTERLHAIMGDGGLSDCGNAQNCVRVCPKEIPLTTAIGELGRQTTVQMLKDSSGRIDSRPLRHAVAKPARRQAGLRARGMPSRSRDPRPGYDRGSSRVRSSCASSSKT
jgi:succinate dehydrogenase / fumarate reductase, iron-sulfur subunit